MAECSWCGNEMRDGVSCTVDVMHRDGVAVRMIPWGKERHWKSDGRRCGDCGTPPGGFHHLGCDIQECAICRGQMFSCECRFDEDGPDAEVDGGEEGEFDA